MICSTCNHYVPDGLIACPVCAEERSRAAMRKYQHHPLALVAQGRGVLTTRAINNVRHVQMFGCAKTYCGETVESYNRRNSILFLALRDEREHICARCADEIDVIVKEAALCSA